MSFFQMEPTAPKSQRVAAAMISAGCAAGMAAPIVAGSFDYTALGFFFGALYAPSFVTRIEPWAYWLNAVVLLPILIAGVGILAAAEARWGAPLVTWPADAMTMIAVLCLTAGSLFLAAPSSKAAARAHA